MLKPGQLSHACPHVFNLLGIECGFAQPVLPHDVRDSLPSGLLLQNGRNLGFAEWSFFILQWSGSKTRFSLLTTGSLFRESYTCSLAVITEEIYVLLMSGSHRPLYLVIFNY